MLVEVAGYQLWRAAVLALLTAFLIQLATKWTCRFKPSYRLTWLACMAAWLAAAMVAAAVDFCMNAIGLRGSFLSLVLMLALGFSVGASIYGRLLQHPQRGPIGYGRGCLVSAIPCIIMTTLFVGIDMYRYKHAVDAANEVLRSVQAVP